MRRFKSIVYLMAVVTSFALIACGGGGVDGAGPIGGDVGASAVADASTTSDNGVTARAGGQIVDVVGNVWKIENSRVYENGTQDPYAYNVSMLLMYNNSAYNEDSSGKFSRWTGSDWEKCDDPRAGATSDAGGTGAALG
jgi:hypothetical protein